MSNEEFIDALYVAGWRSLGDAQHENIRKLLDECALSDVQELPVQIRDGMWWPDGYVTDPNGAIVPPRGRSRDYNFGYDQGYSDGLLSIKDSVKAIEERVRAALTPEGYKLAPLDPTLEMYNAAVIDFCNWEVKCSEENRAGEEFSQPNFSHSDVYRAMLAASPKVQS